MPGLVETLEGIQYEHEAHEKLVEEVYLAPFKVCLILVKIGCIKTRSCLNRPSPIASRNTLIWWRLLSTLLHLTRIRTQSNQSTTKACKGWPLNSWRWVVWEFGSRMKNTNRVAGSSLGKGRTRCGTPYRRQGSRVRP